YNGVVLASPAYNNELFPSMKNVIEKFLERKMAKRLVAVMGISTWSGGGVKGLLQLTEALGWEIVADAHEAKYAAGPADLEKCRALAKTLSQRVLNS
ncbi:MAG: hypothetical protein PHX07_01805, partial [Candidatus Marinimicrobia bacterium]|nr:hypothetical protein [Candidatus Neomarinimicrobiota bacterium]